jgi:3-phosphoinositide dependent protein kinase-1
MHGKKIAHRDLKPENILLTSKLHCKLTDFGDSKKFNEEEELKAEEMANQEVEDDDRNSLFNEEFERAGLPRGSFVGTPLYVSPEMLSANMGGPANDLWALGCIIYQCLVGSVPFSGQSQMEVFKKIECRELEFPYGLGSEAIDIIDRLLHLDPDERLGAGLPGSENSF